MILKKRLLILFFCLFIQGVCMGKDVLIGEPKIELQQVQNEKKIIVQMIVKNNSNDRLIIPKTFLKLFDGKYIISDWFLVKNKGNKPFFHKTKFVNIYFKPEQSIDEKILNNSVIIDSGESYIVEYTSFINLYFIPFWTKTIYIEYDGPLGTSNILEVKI